RASVLHRRVRARAPRAESAAAARADPAWRPGQMSVPSRRYNLHPPLPSLSMSVHTAIVPAAGLGTRFLPATKTVPKELFPVVDTPGIELVALEAAKAGAQRLVIVTSPGKEAIAEYFRPQPELERTL